MVNEKFIFSDRVFYDETILGIENKKSKVPGKKNV